MKNKHRKKVLYKQGEVCIKCGIEFRNREKEWSSTCTVDAPPMFKASGHSWNRDVISN